MVVVILDYDDDFELDEIILSLMIHIFPNSNLVSHKFDFAKSVTESMQEQLK